MPALTKVAQGFCLSFLFLLSQTFALAGQSPNDLTRARTLHLLSATNQLIANATKKSAIVFYGIPATTARTESNTLSVVINGPPNSSFGAALAVAIDTHGYFLTAAHAAENPALTLVFHDGTQLRAAPARVVAKVPNRSQTVHALDLALLHVADTQLTNIFTWAEIDSTPLHNSIALQIGAAEKEWLTETNALLQLAAFAGHVKKLSPLGTGGATFQTDLPARLGDSGGPLINTNGQLLAIHSGVRKPLLASICAIATHPDLTWLRNTIASDQESPPPPSNIRLQFSREPIYITVRLPL
jgi:S1-C subfamily serine protease